MQAFTFRLQPLLDQKLDLYKEASSMVAEKERVLQEQRSAFLSLAENRTRIQCAMVRTRDDLLPVSGMNAGADIQRKNDYLTALKKDYDRAHSAMLVQKFAVEEAELTLAEAQTYASECFREAEKLSKYRERLEKRFAAEAGKKEVLEQDELGTNMYLSRRAGI